MGLFPISLAQFFKIVIWKSSQFQQNISEDLLWVSSRASFQTIKVHFLFILWKYVKRRGRVKRRNLIINTNLVCCDGIWNRIPISVPSFFFKPFFFYDKLKQKIVLRDRWMYCMQNIRRHICRGEWQETTDWSKDDTKSQSFDYSILYNCNCSG